MKWLKIVKSSATNITYQSDTGTTLNAQPNDLLKKNVLLLFNRKDRATIRELASCYISHKDEYDFLWLGGLYAFYIGILLVTTLFSPVTIHILGTVQPGGILIFPLTFVILDSVNEIFQYRYARRLTYLTSAIQLFACAAVYICLNVNTYSPAFHNHMDSYPLLYLVSAFTLPIADQTNNIVFRLMRYRLATCPLWLRSVVSTVTGQLTYTIAWITLFFGTSIDTALLTRIVDNYGFKVIYAACLVPITYLIVAVYRARKPAIENQPSVVGEV
ncbi:queuosine precursor transporter [Vibrio salinus]|uniref:queuosine precursor transporter n=1 Tax=Vibrio salinus TaxID=2899784 RepID=UPI001E338CDF|nr:queuosine precursor transporter [Vibrio salinus]MCE0494707.1 queuosine precursor transporter [Vibrio salinus]